MKALRLKQEDIGKAIHRERSVVSKILKGTTRLQLDDVHPLATVLEVDPFEILYRVDFWKQGRMPAIRSAAILTDIEAGQFADLPPDTPAPLSNSGILVQTEAETIFALRVHGDSMNNIAPSGSYIIVDYSIRSLKDKELGVFRHDGEATFKQYREENGERWLQPDSSNPRHVPIFPSPELEIAAIGRVIDIRPEYVGVPMQKTQTRPRKSNVSSARKSRRAAV